MDTEKQLAKAKAALEVPMIKQVKTLMEEYDIKHPLRGDSFKQYASQYKQPFK